MSRRPYWAGKAPDWVDADADEAAPAADAGKPALLTTASQGATIDPRLQRLAQRQGSVAERRSTREAVVVRRRSRSPRAAAGAEDRRDQDAISSPSALPAEQGSGEGEVDEDEEAIAARRLALRARRLAAEAEVAAGPAVDEVWLQRARWHLHVPHCQSFPCGFVALASARTCSTAAEGQASSHLFRLSWLAFPIVQGSEESSEYTTDDDEDSDHDEHLLLKPAFVPRTEREVSPSPCVHNAAW